MVGLKPAATVASAGALYLLASSIFRRKMLARHGVATTLVKYARLRFLMMRSGGWKSMLVLADFDRTITTASCGTSCHGVVESCQELSAEYRAKTQVLFDKYFPIETNPTMGREEKIPLMQEWSAPSDDLSWHFFHSQSAADGQRSAARYQQAHTLLLAEPFTPALLDSAAERSKAALRPGFEELFSLCRLHGAPLVVCSAGLGNVVSALLKHRLESAEAVAAVENISIVSNWLRFDERQRVCGFSQPLLHMFNKNGAFVRSQCGEDKWANLAADRKVCLLLGDGLGDATMADGLDLPHVLKIGFLNETDEARVAARLPQYEAAFDAVILGDQSFSWLLSLLRSL